MQENRKLNTSVTSGATAERRSSRKKQDIWGCEPRAWNDGRRIRNGGVVRRWHVPGLDHDTLNAKTVLCGGRQLPSPDASLTTKFTPGTRVRSPSKSLSSTLEIGSITPRPACMLDGTARYEQSETSLSSRRDSGPGSRGPYEGRERPRAIEVSLTSNDIRIDAGLYLLPTSHPGARVILRPQSERGQLP